MTSNRRRLAAQRKKSEEGKATLSDAAEYVAVAKYRRPHGLQGEALVAILTDFPERITVGAKFFLGENRLPITIKSLRHHNDGLLLTFEEFPSRKSLEGRQNQLVYTQVDALPALEDGEYYHHQLLGFDVIDLSGQKIGLLVDILVTGANDVYVVRPENGKDILLPATDEVVKEINLGEKRMQVELIPGLLDE